MHTVYTSSGIFRILPAIKIENTTHGTRESREKIRPIVPAVEGIIIRTAEASPHRAVVRVKVRSLSLSITHEKMKSVIAFKI